MIAWWRQNFNVCVVVYRCLNLISCWGRHVSAVHRGEDRDHCEKDLRSWRHWAGVAGTGAGWAVQATGQKGLGFWFLSLWRWRGKLALWILILLALELVRRGNSWFWLMVSSVLPCEPTMVNWHNCFQHDCILSSLIFFPEKGRKWLWTSHGKWKTTRNCWFLWVFINPKWLLAFDSSYSFWDLHVLQDTQNCYPSPLPDGLVCVCVMFVCV